MRIGKLVDTGDHASGWLEIRYREARHNFKMFFAGYSPLDSRQADGRDLLAYFTSSRGTKLMTTCQNLDEHGREISRQTYNRIFYFF